MSKHGTRQTLAVAVIGTPEALDGWAVHPAPADLGELLDDRAVDVALRALWGRFMVETGIGPAVIARATFGALVVSPAGAPVGTLRLMSEYLSGDLPRAEWTPTTRGTDYASPSFSGQTLRGLVAVAVGGGCRPDQVQLEWLDVTEAALRRRRADVGRDVLIPPAGWDEATAEKFRRELVDKQRRRLARNQKRVLQTKGNDHE